MSASSKWNTFALILAVLFFDVTSVPLIRAPWGSIQGVEVQGRDGKKMNGYLGIPYALPPTGKLRWQKPQPHLGPGAGRVFEATTLLPACPQFVPWMGVYNGTSENCLTLNVFVPVSDDVIPATLKPVMVWIHGGGFNVGDAASYRPRKLVMDNDIIVVTIQYRLGVFGFLSTGDATAPGNYGLWDQRLALVWVKDNIQAFGGDPDLVTAFGESAGAISVGLHSLSRASTGLFKRAITQSGSPYMVNCFPDNSASKVRDLAAALGCASEPDVPSAVIVECLQDQNAEDVARADSVLAQKSNAGFLFMPRVDGEFVPEKSAKLLRDELYVTSVGMGELDVLSGFTNNEGALLAFFLTLGAPQDVLTARFFRDLLATWMKCSDLGQASEMAFKVLEYLYRGPDAFTDKPVSMDTLTQMFGDALLNAPCLAWIRSLAVQSHTGKRYLYWVDHDASFNQGGPLRGTHHADDLLFEFEFLSESPLFGEKTRHSFTPEEEKLSSDFVTMLADFARTGNPAVHLRTWLGGDLPEFTVEDEAFLSLSISPNIQHHVMRERLSPWLQLLPELANATSRPTPKVQGHVIEEL